MKEYEKILKALANKRRLEIIRYLKNKKEATVGEIATNIKLSFKATSKHLAIMYTTNLLEKDQRSLEVFYSLSDKSPKLARAVISMV